MKRFHSLPFSTGAQVFGDRAFTLVELLVTISVVAILTCLIMPTMAKAKAKVQCAICINNLMQLQKCWQMYVDDNDGRVPPNRSASANGAWRSTSDSWIGYSNATRDTSTDSIKAGLLYRYDYNRSVGIYRCPSDRSTVQLSNGQTGPLRTRSYSMNGNLGGRTNEMQNTVLTFGGVQNPSELFAFIDEHEQSIDDAHFLVWPRPDDRWVNLPADRHGRTGVLSFVDGHVEAWRWESPKRFRPKESYWKQASGADLNDLRRLQRVILHVENYKRQP